MGEPDTPIQFGVLGCAGIARKLSRAILQSPNASLCAIASRSINKARTFAQSNGFPPSTKIYGSYEELLDDADVDAVYVPLPTSLHRKWAVAAAEKGKHVLLEKPVALSTAEFDVILAVCESSGVQFMDATMWMHHPRTRLMKEFLSDPLRFGHLKTIQSTITFAANPEFLENDIRVKPDLDAFGALGDVGWYCVRASLWAADYDMPKFIQALPGAVKNDAGVILCCTASFHWNDGKVAIIHCSFFSNLTHDITVMGTKGTLHVHDFCIPCKEKVATFTTASETWFLDMYTEWSPQPSEQTVTIDLPQEGYMVKEFASLVGNIKQNRASPEMKWPVISRKTQLLLDAIKSSVDNDCEKVEIVY